MASTLPPTTTMDWIDIQEAKLIMEELKLLASSDDVAITLLSRFPVIRKLAELRQLNQPLFEHTWAYHEKHTSEIKIFGVDGKIYRLAMKDCSK